MLAQKSLVKPIIKSEYTNRDNRGRNRADDYLGRGYLPIGEISVKVGTELGARRHSR